MNIGFGQRLKDLRITKGLTLRQCSEAVGADASNWSKLEREINPAPKDPIVEQWAHFFGLTGEDRQTFLDLASLSRKEIPKDIAASDAVVLEALPVFFRAARGAEMDDEKLARFVEQVRKLHSPDPDGS